MTKKRKSREPEVTSAREEERGDATKKSSAPGSMKSVGAASRRAVDKLS